jgi:predicted nucleotidyltransferase
MDGRSPDKLVGMSELVESIQYLREQLGNHLIAIYQFGSFGTPYHNAQSDLDLAVLCDQPLDPMKKWALAQEIAFRISKDVDLIDLFEASTVFRYQILNEGKLVYCSNETVCSTFDTYVFSDYLDFNERRRDLLQDIHKRGNIGG